MTLVLRIAVFLLLFFTSLARGIAAPGSDLRIEIIQPDPKSMKGFDAGLRALTVTHVRFKNTGTESILIVKPLIYSVLRSFYQVVIFDSSGKELPPRLGCGNKDPDPLKDIAMLPGEYVLPLWPGEVYETWVFTAQQLPATGSVTVHFKYAVPKATNLNGLKLPENIWRGEISAPPLTVQFPP